MELEQGFTRESYFDALQEKYPQGMEVFCKWIDEYKKAAGWNELFDNLSSGLGGIKFHDIPFEMQIGILCKFMQDQDDSGDSLQFDVTSKREWEEQFKLMISALQGQHDDEKEN